MISGELEAMILRLYHAEKWRIGTIATQVGVHHSTVRRVLSQAGITAGRNRRRSMADPYMPFITETLEKWPRLCASRLYEMVKARGYPGRPDHFRAVVSLHRPRPPAEAYHRLRTLPGEQAQVDWAHFGKLRIGRAVRPLMGFVMVLSYSRKVFLRFYLNARMESFLRGHLDAFDYFGGVARIHLYDNLKSAVLDRIGDAIRFNPRLLELASHYRFEPRPVAPARGNEKGRVERAIRYIRDAFIAGRTWSDLDDLNAQALAFINGPADERRCPGERSLTVHDAYLVEKPLLLPLPEHPFHDEERVEVHSGKTPYVRFDGNDYSVPHLHVRKTLTLMASPTSLRILDGSEVIATHERSWDKDQQVEDAAHIQALTDAKRKARTHRGMDFLTRAAPLSEKLLQRLAEQGRGVGGAVTKLVELLELYGSEELEASINEVLERGAAHPAAVRQELERRRHQRGLPAPVLLALPDDPRARNLVVRHHALSAYDEMLPKIDTNKEKS